MEAKYKVVKIYRDKDRRVTLRRNLTREEAKRVVKSYPNRDKSMVVFMEQKHTNR